MHSMILATVVNSINHTLRCSRTIQQLQLYKLQHLRTFTLPMFVAPGM